MIGLIPYAANVSIRRLPISNLALIGLISLVSLSAIFGPGDTVPDALILDGWSLSGLFGHVFMHAGLVHLIGNMLFLWVFGNAICAKVGNFKYLAFFFTFALTGAVVHNLIDPSLAVGASGAINGVIGMFVIYFPLNEITCWWLVFFRFGAISISSIWIIMLWLAFDIWGATAPSGPTAYWAHLGGFAAGAILAAVTLTFGWVKLTKTDRSIFDVLAGRR